MYIGALPCKRLPSDSGFEFVIPGSKRVGYRGLLSVGIDNDNNKIICFTVYRFIRLSSPGDFSF